MNKYERQLAWEAHVAKGGPLGQLPHALTCLLFGVSQLPAQVYVDRLRFPSAAGPLLWNGRLLDLVPLLPALLLLI
jgi:hypothetical protein